jgi:hypothetical protein
MFDYNHLLEALCRSLPELVAGCTFFLRRTYVDTRHVEMVLGEFGVDAIKIQNQRLMVDELVDFESLKKDWDNAFLTCILTYVALAFVASPKILYSGIAIWIIAFVIVRFKLSEDSPGSMFRSRRLTTMIFVVVLTASAAGKVATVLFAGGKS